MRGFPVLRGTKHAFQKTEFFLYRKIRRTSHVGGKCGCNIKEVQKYKEVSRKCRRRVWQMRPGLSERSSILTNVQSEVSTYIVRLPTTVFELCFLSILTPPGSNDYTQQMDLVSGTWRKKI